MQFFWNSIVFYELEIYMLPLNYFRCDFACLEIFVLPTFSGCLSYIGTGTAQTEVYSRAQYPGRNQDKYLTQLNKLMT